MILPASQDMSHMNELFSTTVCPLSPLPPCLLTPLELQLQGRTQVSPWFPSTSDYTFLLSGDPSPSSRTPPSHPPLDPPTIDPVEKVRPVPPTPPLLTPLQQSLFAVPRPPVLRHQSFPQDVQSTVTTPLQNGSTPSLVTSLQKVHGLSRKKLYGTQPPRQPFVREEPVRSKYKSTPTPLSIPVGSQPFPIAEDGRILGKTKVERGRRADRHIGDASNSCSPGRRSPWNHIPSDVGSSPSSPTTSLSSHHTTSPTIPLYPDLAGYPTSPPATSAAYSPSIPETSFSSPLCDPSGGYLSPFQSPVIPVPSQGPAWTPLSKPAPNPIPMAKSAGTPTTNRRHSQELPHGSHMQSLSAMSSKYRLDTVSTEPRPTPKNMQKVKDAGDVPFIFSPELEAATAAKLQAALQSTSPVSSSSTVTLNQFSAFTSGNPLNYAPMEDACASDLFLFLFFITLHFILFLV